MTARQREIAEAAAALLDEQGLDGLSMRALADRLGIRAPSLYAHFRDKAALEAAVVAAGMQDLRARFEGAGPGLRALAAAYRAFALERPHLHRLIEDRPLPRALLPDGLEDATAAPLLAALGGDRALARAAWGMVHGLVSLELAGRFPGDADVDAAYAAGVAAFTRAL